MRSTVTLTAAALVLSAVLTACGTGPPDHVRIGLVAPLSGPRAFLGQEMLDGARMAVEDLNDAGGLLGSDIELVVADDTDLVDLPGALADLAERSRVSAVVGPEAPGVVIGPRSPLSRRDVPAVLPTAFGGELDEAGTFVARTVPSARDQAEALGWWLSEVRSIDDVAVLVADPVEGPTVRDDLRSGLEQGGAEVVEMLEVDGDAGTLGPAVSTLRERAGDVGGVLLWGTPSSVARATLAVRDQGWDVQLMVPASAFVAEYRTLAEDATEGVVLAFPFRWEWFEEPELTNWMVRYNRDFGIGALPQLDTLVLDLPVVAAAAYDAVHIVADAVARAETRVPEEVADALTEVRTDGLLRTYRLDDHEAWEASDLHIARFHHLGVVYDVDPRLDAERQRQFWEMQVQLDFLPQSVLEGPAGDLIRRAIEARKDEIPDYSPPRPPPGPVGRP